MVVIAAMVAMVGMMAAVLAVMAVVVRLGMTVVTVVSVARVVMADTQDEHWLTRTNTGFNVGLLFHELVEGTSQRRLVLRWKTWGVSISVVWQIICVRGILWQTITMICGFHDSSGI